MRGFVGDGCGRVVERDEGEVRGAGAEDEACGEADDGC